jgi:outer membrane protein
VSDRAAIALASLVIAMLSSPAATAREEPLWEAGAGVAALGFPDYRGSDHSRAYAFPSPYFVYRGDFLKADRYGLRGVFLKTERLDLNLSLGASLPVRSSDIPVREGMPDLRPAVELGPSLAVTAWRSRDERLKLDLRLPVRGAITIESQPRYIGVQFFPHVNLDIHDPAGFTGWNLGLLAGPVYTDKRYNRYFYEVQPQFIAALSKRFPKSWVGGFVRYDALDGAHFESSPLVTSKRYVAGGIGISWILGESSRRVPVADFGDERR